MKSDKYASLVILTMQLLTTGKKIKKSPNMIQETKSRTFSTNQGSLSQEYRCV